MSADARSRRVPAWLLSGLVTAGSLVLLVAVVIFGLTVSQPWSSRAPARVADKTGKTVFAIGQVEDLGGTDLVRMDIAATSRGGGNPYGSGSSRGGIDLRNILLLDKATGNTRKLLPNNDRHIESNSFLAASSDRGRAPRDLETRKENVPPPAYYLLTVRTRDDAPSLDVIVGTLVGGRQATVMRGIAGIESSWMQSETAVGLIVREGLALHYRIVDMASLTVVTSRRIDIG